MKKVIISFKDAFCSILLYYGYHWMSDEAKDVFHKGIENLSAGPEKKENV